MALSPVASQAAAVDLSFIINDGQPIDVSPICIRFEFKAMMNGGYVIMGRLKDADFNIGRRLLLDSDYLSLARSTIFSCQFRIKWANSDNQTTLQTAYIISLTATGRTTDEADIEFIAIDPPSWYLNAGKASGKVYKGKVSDVIQAVVGEYAPGIALDISATTDSSNNMFWMMGMDPKTFISSLVDWSCSLTRNKTQWIIAMDNTNMQIKAQDEIASQNVGFYTGPHCGENAPDIRDWELLADSALSIVNTKLVTQGISAVSGQYLDTISDTTQSQVVVKDANTPNKYKARVGAKKSFTKPPDGGPPSVGYTAIPAIPEIYSAGEIGQKYSDYIDGRPRGLWLNMANMVMRCRFRVIGHGVYSNGLGLGVNTVTLQWNDVDGQPFFLAGNWILYGFDHIYTTSDWATDLYCARFDYNAAATEVPPLPPGG